MIYETAVVLRADLNEEAVGNVIQAIESTITEGKGEVLVKDDWGTKTFAQPTHEGVKNGKYIYFMYRACGDVNVELERRFRINEGVLKNIIVKLGEEAKQEEIVKAYKNPNSASTSEDGRSDAAKEKKLFSKRKSCWFSAKKTAPDWKDPNSYSWLVNEFGKISPARITGLRPKFQRMATTAIKRGRCMGMISYMSNDVIR